MKRSLILVLGITLFNCFSGYAGETEDRRQKALELFGRYSTPKPGFQVTPRAEDQDSGFEFPFEMDKPQEKPKPLPMPKEKIIETKGKTVKPQSVLAKVLNNTSESTRKKFEFCIKNPDITLSLVFPEIDTAVSQKRFGADWMAQSFTPVSTYMRGWFVVADHIPIHKLNWDLYHYSQTNPQWTGQGLQLTFCYQINNGRNTGDMIYPTLYIPNDQIGEAIKQFREGTNFQYTFQLEKYFPVVSGPVDMANHSIDAASAPFKKETNFQYTFQPEKSSPVVNAVNQLVNRDNHSPD